MTISQAEIVKEIKVIGNVRVSPETIALFGDIVVNEDYDAQKINQLTKQLYDTDFFSYIEIDLSNGILKINDPINLENYVTKNLKDKKSEIYINEMKVKNSNKQVLNIVYEKKLNLIYD